MSKGKAITIGYKYYLGIQYAICYGPVNAMTEIQVGDRQAWTGNQAASGTVAVNAPELFGGEKKEGGIQGDLYVAMGDSGQSPNTYLQSQLGASIPACRGILTAVFNGMVSAMNPYIKPWAFRVKRITAGWNGSVWYSGKAAIGNDMNPAHIVYECMTNPQWGMGYPTSSIDGTNFAAVADTLYSENFGLSMLWNNTEQIKSFVQMIMDHIGGVLQLDRKSGQFKIKLLRLDYSIGSLPIINQTNAVLESLSRSAWGETANEITVVYTDATTGKQKVCSAQDLANIEIQGAVVNRKANYQGITSDALAQRVALRDLKAASAALTKARIKTNRSAWDYLPGDVVRLQWTPLGIDAAYRVVSINWGTLQSGEIQIDLVEDIFGMPQSSYTGQQPVGWTEPSHLPAQSPTRILTETPYYDLARTLSEADLAYLDPTYCRLDVYARRPSSDALDYDLWTGLSAGALEERSTGSHPVTASTVYALAQQETTVMTLDNIADLNIRPPTIGSYVILNGEYMRLDSYNTTTQTINVQRGVLDTVPKAHNAGGILWFAADNAGQDGVDYVQSDIVYAKCQTKTSRGELDITSISADNYTMNRRQDRPYPPGQLRINGNAYPSTVTGAVTVAWAHRDRLTQTASIIPQSSGNIGPEAGVTYTVRFVDDATTVRTVTGISGTSYAYTIDDEIADGGPFDPLRIRVEAVRGGITSWQQHDVSVARVLNYVISIAQSGTTYTTAASTSQTIPAATVVGDLLLAFVMHRSALTTPAGWTLVDSQANPTGPYDHTLSIISRTAQGGDAGASLAVTQASSTVIGIHIITLRHLNGGTCEVKTALTAKTATDGETSTFAAAVATANAAGQLGIIAMSWDLASSPTTVTPPANWLRSTPASDSSNRICVARRIRNNTETTAGSIATNLSSANQVAAISLIVGVA